jgi:outer membrane protein assembly factor BamE (lipoprotein component of BamABCDE complex)
MDIIPFWSKCRFRLPTKGEVPAREPHNIGSIRRSQLIISAMAIVILATGCATPHVQPADPQLLFKSELLEFIQEGVTTREEVVLKLGIPSAQLEGDKILMYQLWADQAGKWHLMAPQINASTGFRAWRKGTCSLVLVFGGDGVLRKHSLVRTE